MTLFWVVVALAAAASFFFTTANYALFNTSRSRLLELLAARGHEQILDRLEAARPTLLLSTSLIRTTMNLVVFVAMLWAFHTPDHGLWWERTLTALLAAAAVVAVFGVAIPISWARYSPESFLAHTAHLLLATAWIMRPFMALLHLFDPLVRRLLGVPPQFDHDPTPAEQGILDALTAAESAGLMDANQKHMIESIVAFPSTTVEQVMTPRTDIEGIPADADLDDVKRFISEAGHSRVPVYDGDLDHIVGVLYAKDLIPLLGRIGPGDAFDLRKIIRPAVFVPETKTLGALLSQMREMKVHMAIVLDEYGGTAGLATIEDLVEEVFGEIRDEYEPPDQAEPGIEKLDEHTFIAHGRVYIHEVNTTVEVELPEEEDYDTLGGFVLARLGRIPEPGETFEHDGCRFTVVGAEKTHVTHVRIEDLRPSRIAQ